MFSYGKLSQEPLTLIPTTERTVPRRAVPPGLQRVTQPASNSYSREVNILGDSDGGALYKTMTEWQRIHPICLAHLPWRITSSSSLIFLRGMMISEGATPTETRSPRKRD